MPINSILSRTKRCKSKYSNKVISNAQHNIMKVYGCLPDLKGRCTPHNMDANLEYMKQSPVPMTFKLTNVAQFCQLRSQSNKKGVSALNLNIEKSVPFGSKEGSYRRSSQENSKRNSEANQDINQMDQKKRIISKIEKQYSNKDNNQFKIELNRNHHKFSPAKSGMRTVNRSIASGAPDALQNLSVHKLVEDKMKSNNPNILKSNDNSETTILPEINSNNGGAKMPVEQFCNRKSFDNRVDPNKQTILQTQKTDKGDELSSIISNYLKQDKIYDNMKTIKNSNSKYNKALKSRNYEVKLTMI